MISIFQYILIFLVSVGIFIIGDLAWLGVIAKDFYRNRLSHLLSETVGWPAAICFYIIFILGLHIFALSPAIASRSMLHALTFGALFGFFTYATYDLTNAATLREWPVIITIVDIIWGTVLAGTVSIGSYWIAVTYIIR